MENSHPESGSDNKAMSGMTRNVLIIAGAIIICLLIAGAWILIVQQNGTISGDPIVGTWTDKNKYWAYAYYGNGSIVELGFYTHHAGSSLIHDPVYKFGTWVNTGNDHYLITPSVDESNATYDAVMNGTTMHVLNTSSGDTHKISNLPDVNQVDFNYVP